MGGNGLRRWNKLRVVTEEDGFSIFNKSGNPKRLFKQKKCVLITQPPALIPIVELSHPAKAETQGMTAITGSLQKIKIHHHNSI